MSLSSPQSLLGAIVLAAGVVALGAAANNQAKQSEATVEEPVVVVDTTTVEIPRPDVEGLDPAIQRVLYDSGKAQAFVPGAVTELPESVAKVLAYYKATLTIATETASQ